MWLHSIFIEEPLANLSGRVGEGVGLSLTLNIKTCNFFFLLAHNSFREEKPQEGAWKESVVVELRCLTGPGP